MRHPRRTYLGPGTTWAPLHTGSSLSSSLIPAGLSSSGLGRWDLGGQILPAFKCPSPPSFIILPYVFPGFSHFLLLTPPDQFPSFSPTCHKKYLGARGPHKEAIFFSEIEKSDFRCSQCCISVDKLDIADIFIKFPLCIPISLSFSSQGNCFVSFDVCFLFFLLFQDQRGPSSMTFCPKSPGPDFHGKITQCFLSSRLFQVVDQNGQHYFLCKPFHW